MYLRALEVQGFKSFPDKTRLTFNGDITAIVGPNGSGKSNISDAIRWVMGEMSSKALRGAKMEDVIFGGTQKRGQLGFAEVSLVLDNADGAFPVDASEVMVTRRYFRSGESEYYINRQSARLKDINELFMDTGLGREGYSNIGQGRIDEILSVKSQDRREIFEEAAGISRYRHRKEETERRLGATDENLVRIGDKIAELELQVEPLRQQAEKAKKYLLYRDELRVLEVTSWLDTLDKLAVTAKKTEEDYNSAKFILSQEHENLDGLYASIERMAESLRGRDAAQEALRSRIGEQDAEAERRAGEIAVLRAQIENNNANISRIRDELAEQDGRSGGIDEQIAQYEARQKEIAGELAALADSLTGARSQDDTLSAAGDERRQQLLALRAQQAAELTELAERTARFEELNKQLGSMHERLEVLGKSLAEMRHRKFGVEEQDGQCAKNLADARENAAAAKNMIDGYRLRLSSRAGKRDELQKKSTALGIELDTVSSRIRMFEEMERDYEGYSKAVRVVMTESQRGALHGVHGPVSRLVRTDDRYTVAIETALGAAMNHIVVGTDADGKAAINLLKRRDAGRATFLPLGTIRGRALTEQGLERQRGFVGVASELVQFDAQYETIFLNLLGRIVIAEQLDAAVAIARQYGYRFRIVTLDGQVVNPGGSMTGGSTVRSAGVLTRANELRRLRGQSETLKKQKDEAEQAFAEAKRLADEVEFQITEAEGRQRLCEDEVLRLEGQAGQYRVILESLNASIDEAKQEYDALEARFLTSEDEQGKMHDALREIKADAETLSGQVAALSESEEAAAQAAAELSEHIHRLQMRAAALEAERGSAEAGAAQLRALQSAMQGDRAVKQSLIDRFAAENEDTQAAIAQAEAALADFRAGTEALRAQFQTAAAARADEEAHKTALEKTTQDKNKDILEMERECARLEQKKGAAAMEEKQILDKLWDSYELTRTTAQAVAQPEGNAAELGRRISELKRKISALGTPNLGAVEEFERVNERYTYLTGQRDDVLTSKRELETIIRDIVGEMTEIFRTEFARINDGFRATFTELFGGGTATLELEDEDDILNCGIEIKAQPPGKQLKSITLLSGGEKALVAIALYFAILKVRPTPFCMLDEIDAALDDRNVAMYAAYLRKLSDRTQFIVITHRRGTMEEADVLYGVTMQEQGISKILTIDLNEMAEQLGIKDER